MHVHGTVQPNGHGQLSARLLPLACPGVQCAEAEVTVRLERTHAEFLGQGQSLMVVGFCQSGLRRLTPRRDLAEEAQGIRLVAMFLVRTGMRQCPLGECLCLLQMTSHELHLSEGKTTARLEVYSFHCSRLCHCLREHGQGVGDAPGQGISRTRKI